MAVVCPFFLMINSFHLSLKSAFTPTYSSSKDLCKQLKQFKSSWTKELESIRFFCQRFSLTSIYSTIFPLSICDNSAALLRFLCHLAFEGLLCRIFINSICYTTPEHNCDFLGFIFYHRLAIFRFGFLWILLHIIYNRLKHVNCNLKHYFVQITHCLQ